MRRILVTGSGGVAGVNFIRAIRSSEEELYIVGTDYSPYYLQFPDVNKRILSPKHSDSSFIPLIQKIISDEQIEFIHPQPKVEAYTLAVHRKVVDSKMYLPQEYIINRDKLETQLILEAARIPVARTASVKGSLSEAFRSVGTTPVWVRTRFGAGGMLSLPCQSPDEVSHWMKLWVMKGRVTWSDFIIQEYLGGRNIAWDSLWFNGELVTSYARERVEYPFKHLTPSGITGTPTVARIIHDDEVNRIGREAVKTLDPNPHGSYSIDLKERSYGVPCVTEVDVGKFHTTAALWSYAATKVLHLPTCTNLPHLYTQIGFDERLPEGDIQQFNVFPEGIYLLRHIDCGCWLWREDGWKVQVL